MIDAKLTKRDDGVYDVTIVNGDLAGVDGFDTAIVVSTLSDRRATADEEQAPERRRGYIGDTVTNDSTAPWGSALWLLGQSRITPAVGSQSGRYVEQSLQWMIDQGIFLRIEVTPSLTLTGVFVAVKLIAKDSQSETARIEAVRATGAA